MKKFALLLVLLTAFLPGCGNLSPRQDPKIDAPNSKIGEIETMANSMKAEIGKLQTQADIQNSKLEKIQQGLANLQINNDNSGVQILSGSGGLMIAFLAITVGGIIAIYYRRNALLNQKTATMLAERIVSHQDPALDEKVFQAAMYTDV